MVNIRKASKILIVCLWLTIFLINDIPRAYSGEVLSTSFQCSEWEGSPGNYVPGCDGIATGDWSANCGDGSMKYSKITSDANRSAGGDGKGWRYWVGNGLNNNSGYPSVHFQSTLLEFWVRYYMRHGKGIKLDREKLCYPPHLYFDFEGGGSGGRTRVVYAGNTIASSAAGKGFYYVNGGPTGDGKWHLYEFYVKFGANGAVACKIDGEAIINASGLDISGHSGADFVRVPSNQRTQHEGCKPIDIDDIAVSTTGWIGPGAISASNSGISSANSSTSSASSSSESSASAPPPPGKPWVVN